MANAFVSRVCCLAAPQTAAPKFYGMLFGSVPSVRLISSSSRILSSEEVRSLQPATSSSTRGEVSIQYRHGLPVVTLPLPSRHEKCQFTLKPVSQTVGDFCDHIRQEDKGIDIVLIYDSEKSTLKKLFQMGRRCPTLHISSLLQLDNFQLRINDEVLLAEPPSVPSVSMEERVPGSSEQLKRFEDVQAAIGALHSSMHVEEYQLKVEQDLVKRLEDISLELAPLERRIEKIKEEAEVRSTRILWVGLAAMGFEIGVFGRLTWWEYSWDIMEPVTYFATFSTAIACFTYYLLTRQSYEYPDAKDRLFLFGLYRTAKKVNLDIHKYNRLLKAKAEVEYDLRRIRDPFYLHLPLSRIQKFRMDRQRDYQY